MKKAVELRQLLRPRTIQNALESSSTLNNRLTKVGSGGKRTAPRLESAQLPRPEMTDSMTDGDRLPPYANSLAVTGSSPRPPIQSRKPLQPATHRHWHESQNVGVDHGGPSAKQCGFVGLLSEANTCKLSLKLQSILFAISTARTAPFAPRITAATTNFRSHRRSSAAQVQTAPKAPRTSRSSW